MSRAIRNRGELGVSPDPGAFIDRAIQGDPKMEDCKRNEIKAALPCQ